MRRLFRWFIGFVLAVVVVAGLSAAIAVGAIAWRCSPDVAEAIDVPAPLVIEPEYHRDFANTYLIFPEWYIVYSFEDFGQFLESNSESKFPYLSHIAGFWLSYCEANRVATALPGNHTPYKVMINVIGLSYTFEYAIKGLYENTIGRLTEWLRGPSPTGEDLYARAVLQDYASFLYQVPWYKYPFGERMVGLWTGTQFVGASPIRNLERKLSLSTEYLLKAGYARLIAFGLAATAEPADLEIVFVVKGDPVAILAREPEVRLVRDLPDDMALLMAPRYQEFTDLMTRLSDHGVEIVEIAGNHRILMSAILPDRGGPDVAGSRPLFLLPIDARPGFNRVGLDVDVGRLTEVITAYRQAGVEVEHLYDY